MKVAKELGIKVHEPMSVSFSNRNIIVNESAFCLSQQADSQKLGTKK